MTGPNVAGIFPPTADTWVVVHHAEKGVHGVYGTFNDWGKAQAWVLSRPVPMRHNCTIQPVKGVG